ncbi:type II toxin-antitoxin system RelE/ParE family toxin [Escherichia coli]|uniref:type II toxin-antitoxin system RelE/ParE family toxin n=1 Tax=Escherichia coli TaxID=562 RepID=UPI001363C780|nr:type II toxin-antitoxin system RelE/ParE family toxin [Escherichia coli]
MITVLSTEIFDNWIDSLKDVRAKTKIQARIRRLKNGNSGDIEPVGEGFSEMRIHEGKGYRVYLKKNGKVIVVLLCGGDKSTQQKDILRAKAIYKEIEGEL